MILLAKTFAGILDISGPEVLGNDCPFDDWLGNTAQFRRVVRTGDVIELPDEYLRFPNIRNAVDGGLLEIISYDSKDESIVINAELSGFSGGGGASGVSGTRQVILDFHGAADTELINVVDGVPFLFFKKNKTSTSTWNVTIPEDYQAGTDVNVEVYWSPASSDTGSVKWELEYKVVAPGSGLSGAMSMSSLTQAASGTAFELQTTGTSLTVPAASVSVDALAALSITRLGQDAADTFGDTARVHLVRVLYTGLVFST